MPEIKPAPVKKTADFGNFRRASVGVLLALSLNWAAADEVSDVQALLASGKSAEGMKKIDQLLTVKPSDPRLRLQRGIALSLLDRPAEAITVFQKLIESHPELPGPYNNLAVMYGNQGDYEKARQALELAIRTNPSSATVFQNLGDVYARLAGQAYKKALGLDKSDGSPPLKLALVQNFFEASVDPRAVKTGIASALSLASPAPAPAPAPVSPTAALSGGAATGAAATPATKASAPAKALAAAPTSAIAAAPAPAAKAAVAAVAPAATAVKPAPTIAAAPAPAPADKAAAAVVAPAAAAAEPAPARADSANLDQQAVTKALQAWAKAWSKRDMSAYYAAYAPQFKGKSTTRKAWEEERRVRIMGKNKIIVTLSDIRIKVTGGRATLQIRQDYNSDSMSVKSTKTLEMLKNKQGDWQITEETVS